jgi:hypothetical protein
MRYRPASLLDHGCRTKSSGDRCQGKGFTVDRTMDVVDAVRFNPPPAAREGFAVRYRG